MIGVTDALGRLVELEAPARRVVSLVPSETHSVALFAGLERLVGRTRYCIAPDGIDAVPTMGGTKDIDVDAVAAAEPDLVLVNKEESSRHGVEALMAKGLTVHVSFPTTLAESLVYLETLQTLLGVPEQPATARLRTLLGTPFDGDALPVFVPIWRDPWMTFDGRVLASDLLRHVGARNVFADRARLYPLAADLGRRAPMDEDRVGDRDTRYPRIRLEEASDRAPALVLLPDEPYEFGPSDATDLAGLGSVAFVSGRDLFWYGANLAEAIPRLRAERARWAGE